MVKTYNIPISELVEKIAGELKNMEELRPPTWSEFAKTGTHKERAPLNEDWWYMRAASILRKIQILGPVGVSKLKTKYGGKKNRGLKPERFYKGSGSIIRKVLQQLESAELIKHVTINSHKGRVLTPKGEKLIAKFNPTEKAKKTEKKPAPAAKPQKQAETNTEPKNDSGTEKAQKPEEKKDNPKDGGAGKDTKTEA